VPSRAGRQRLPTHGLDRYDPLLARTRSDLEAAYLRLGLPPPDDVNVLVEGVSCDIVYYDAKLIVMLDGVGNHRSRGQVRRDLADAFTLRRRGWLVLRYGEAEIYGQPAAVRAEITAELARRVGIGQAGIGRGPQPPGPHGRGGRPHRNQPPPVSPSAP
jgi:hypothetical protein